MSKIQRRGGYLLAALLVLGAVLASCGKDPVAPPEPVLATPPQLDPPSGDLDSLDVITITCSDPDVVIKYTLDGSDPTELSARYTQPLQLSQLFPPMVRNGVLKARSFKPGRYPSLTVSGAYTIEMPPLPASFVLIPGGTFNNGSANVNVSSFYLDSFELTQASYQAVMGANPSYFPGPDKPVERVSWFDAIAYCNRRSIREGLTPCYSYGQQGMDPDNWPLDWNQNDINHAYVYCNWDATGYRLPTEMEWMFAARGGSGFQGYIYPGGNNLGPLGWYLDNCGAVYGSTQSVGQKQANELGLFDMAGNVAEIVWDVFSAYPVTYQVDYRGPNPTLAGEPHCVRGGSFQSMEEVCRVDARGQTGCTSLFNHTGFRLARRAMSAK